MFIFDWFWGALSALGLYHKSAKIVFLGLDNAGKTTLLHMLRDDKLGVHYPTQKPTMEELTMGKIKFRTYDLGGHEQARKVWREYFPDVSAIIYLVDSADPKRFAESKAELAGLLKSEEIASVPIAVLANKIDKPLSVSEEEFRKQMGLEHTYGKEKLDSNIRPIDVFMCSIVKRVGYNEAFQWISNFI